MIFRGIDQTEVVAVVSGVVVASEALTMAGDMDMLEGDEAILHHIRRPEKLRVPLITNKLCKD